MKQIEDIEDDSGFKSNVTYDFSPKQSDWGSINELFLGRITLCDKEGNLDLTSPSVSGIVLDADMAVESQYNSPFENSNPESRLPTLMGMLQAGDWVNSVDQVMGGVLGKLGIGNGQSILSEDMKQQLNQLEGRSNFTKVNSTQIFVASSPVRLNIVMFFEAWESAKFEVEHQIATLQQWSLSGELSDQSILANLAQNLSLQSLFPSLAPPFISFLYAKKRVLPLLIENVSAPMVTPMDEDGNRLIVEVPMTLISRQAFDKNNIKNMYI